MSAVGVNYFAESIYAKLARPGTWSEKVVSVWQQWLGVWLSLLELPEPKPIPEDQFSVSTEQGLQYVLENCTDHVIFSLRYPAVGYSADRIARRLLELADPHQMRPYPFRLGHDGTRYCIIAIQLKFESARPEDAGTAFEQLWSIADELAAL